MPKLNWDGNDFRNPQDSSGTVADNISRNGNLQQGYFHGSLTEGLVAYYRMDAGSGTTLTDHALDNHGTINGASWSSNSKLGDNCLDFNGSGDNVDLPGSETLDFTGKNQITISVWANADSWGSDSYFVADEGNNTFIFRWEDPDLEFLVHANGTWHQDIGLNSTPSTNEWINVVGLYDGQDLKVYYNGSLVESKNIGHPIDGNNNPTPAIGYRRTNSDRYMDGKLDDIRIYERALTEPEIKALYNLNNPSKVTPGDTLK